MDVRGWGIVAVVIALSMYLGFLFFIPSVGQIHGYSMYPTLKDGDFVFLGSGAVEEGDVVVFSFDPFSGVAHRVVSVNPSLGYVVTAGDNPRTNPWDDPYPVFSDRIVGKVICRFRFPFLG